MNGTGTASTSHPSPTADTVEGRIEGMLDSFAGQLEARLAETLRRHRRNTISSLVGLTALASAAAAVKL